MMRGRIGALFLAGALAGCASSPPDTSVADALGEPFFLAFKVPFCLTTLVLGAPLAAATGFAPDPQSLAIRRDLDVGMRRNCGPPYTLAEAR